MSDNFSNNAVEIPEKIIEAYKDGRKVLFLLQFQGGVVYLVESKVANEMYPQIVIKFYEERLKRTLRINI